MAVDPVEGTEIVAAGGWNALAVLAIADKGNLLHAPDMYMDKIAVGPESKGKVSINASVTENLQAVAKAKNKNTVFIITVKPSLLFSLVEMIIAIEPKKTEPIIKAKMR